MLRFQSLHDYPQLYKQYSGKNRLTLAVFGECQITRSFNKPWFNMKEETVTLRNARKRKND